MPRRSKKQKNHNAELHKLVPELAAATKYRIEIAEQEIEKYKKSSKKALTLSGEIDAESAGMIASRMGMPRGGQQQQQLGGQPLQQLGGQQPGQQPQGQQLPTDARTPAQKARAENQARDKAEREARQKAEK